VKELPALLVGLLGCAKPEPTQPTPTPVDAVSVAPQSTGSPNEPVLLVGPQKPMDPNGGDVERVMVKDGEPDASFQPPKDRCPEGVTEMIAVHIALGESMELAPGADPVSALGRSEAVDVVYDRSRKIVRITARRYGLVFVLTERSRRCTWYGVNSGY
jgi:hypothetical protein